MIPSHFIQVAGDLPLTSSGNVNWGQMTRPAGGTNGTQHGPPGSETNVLSEEVRVDYWASQLEDSQPAEFLYDYHRPTVLSGMAVTRKLAIDSTTCDSLRQMSDKYNVPPPTILLAFWRATHYRMTGMADANIGTLCPDGTQNMQCLRIEVDDDDTFEQLVQHMASVQGAASQHAGVSLEKIHDRMKRPLQHPLVRMALTFHSPEAPKRPLEEIENQPIFLDVEVLLYQEQNAISGFIRYASDLYAAPTIRAILSVFSELLERGLQSPGLCPSTTPLTREYSILEAMGLLDVCPGKYPRTSSIVDLFEEMVASHPEHVVVKDSSRQLTYAQLDQESRHLASWLKDYDLAPETIVAVFAPRSCEALVAILGILRAGLAYVPMDYRWPSTRVEAVLSSLSTRKVLLVGTGVYVPEIAVDNLDMIPIREALQKGSQTISPRFLQHRPSPNNLAYVIFTSGSTGQPKGVMTEHQAVIARVRPPIQLCTAGVTGKGVAHMANLAFDVGNWEIYMALLNAGTIVCIDSMTILNYAALDEVFTREAVRIAVLTPALLKELITVSPQTISQLESLIVGGEKTDPTTMFHARKLIGSGEVSNGYGPSEHTYFSSRYSLPATELCTNGVPIGRVLPGSGAYVMDPNQSLVPLGVLGELVVTGDGLARGYTDLERNKDRFITVAVQGCQMRAYRTGDRVRYRPGDGLLEFFGRMDNQVKVRGHRIELGEIETAIKNQAPVDTAVVLLQKRESDQEHQLVAFVTERAEVADRHDSSQDGELARRQATRAHEDLWKAMFATDTYDGSLDVSCAGRDFLGWNSMYDGREIDKVEMNEWLDDAIRQFCNGSSDLGHVLEIGTGSGMILFNILDKCTRYTGLDPVGSMSDFVRRAIREIRPDAQDKVQLHVGTASNLGNVPIQHGLDTAIVNSVAQYFPSADYLHELIAVLLYELAVQTLFFGDMRTYALYSQFKVSKTLHGPCKDVDEMRRIMAEIERSETELLVDPAFFMTLTEQFPDIVHHVEILPKRMKACNELSCYRYAAVVHRVGTDCPPVHVLDENEWIDARASNISQSEMLELLQETSQKPNPRLALANIPHRKTMQERLIVEALPSLPSHHAFDWMEQSKKDADESIAFDIAELFHFAEQTGFRVEVSWARQFSQHGAFDAVFHRIPSAHGKDRTLFHFPSDHRGRPAQQFTNNPMCLTSSAQRTSARQLRETLKAQLPSYMVPAVITILDHMPVNTNGKVDRQALARMQVEPQPDGLAPDQEAPHNELEGLICQGFSRVLACPVGITDNFYDLGGHSLMATRAIFQIAQQLRCSLTIRDLIDAPTPKSLAEHISSMNLGSLDTAELETADLPLLPPLDVDDWQVAARTTGLDLAEITRVMPCSPFQEGVLTADMALAEQSGYREIINISLPVDLDQDALRRAWEAIVKQEDMLRTVFFPAIPDQALPKQGIAGNVFIQAILRPDAAEVSRVVTIDDLEAPLDCPSPNAGLGHVPVSMSIASIPNLGEHRLTLNIHHALHDGLYLSMIVNRLADAYNLARHGSPPTPHHYDGDVPFSAFIRMLQTRDCSRAQSFWKTYLHGAAMALWPISTPTEGAERGQRPPLVETASWTGNTKTLARKLHSTPASIGRAAVALMVSAHGNAEDIVLGEVSSGRHYSGFVTGPCIATHPVRIRLTNSRNERLDAHKIVKTAADSYADTIPHQHFGLAAIREASGHPDQLPFQVLYVYQYASEAPVNVRKSSDSPAAFVSRRGNSGRVDFPLVIEAFCAESTSHMQFHCTYDPAVLPPQDAGWVVRRLLRALDIMSASIDSAVMPVQSYQLIDAEELKMLQVFSVDHTMSNGAHDAPDQCVHHLVHKHAQETPEKIALQFEQREFVTYNQLDERSTNLSRAIHTVLMKEIDERGLVNQPLVPICFDKTPHMVIAMLAVLKAGAAYIPLDPEQPIVRLTAVCNAADARMVICGDDTSRAKLHSVCRDANCSLWTVDDLRQVDPGPTTKMQTAVVPSDLAYVLFTSGSAGIPKGVMVEHRNLTAFMTAQAGSTDCSWTSNRLSLLEYIFDASMGDIFGTLGKGGRLSLVRRGHLMPQLVQWLDDLAISHLTLTPTIGGFLFDHLERIGSRVEHLHTLVFGGESLGQELLSRIPQNITVWNGYGPTETTIEVTAAMLQGSRGSPSMDRPSVSIGRPTGQNRIHVLVPGTEEQVPIGVVGELCVSGPQVSRGYLSEEELGAERFVRDPLSATGTMYRTGDLVRWKGNGNLQFLGRMDQQMKLRGLRIEPTDIVAAAEAHHFVKSCVVTKVNAHDAEALVAIALVEDAALHDPRRTAAEISQSVSSRVPRYMVPAQIQLRTEPLPQTSSGKTDLRAVTRLAEEGYRQFLDTSLKDSTSVIRPAAGSLEARIATHWAGVLRVSEDRISIDTPFSQLGGGSLRAISLLAAFRRDGLPLHMNDLGHSATITSQATKIHEVMQHGQTQPGGPPGHMHIYTRQSSVATVVLIHSFLGHSKVLEPLVPFLSSQFNVILFDDPHFGSPQWPLSLTAWASEYLLDVAPYVPKHHSFIVGGYSFGGLIAIEMAELWNAQWKSYPASLILLDPGTYAPTLLDNAGQEQKRAAAQAALGLLDVDQHALAWFEEHYERHNNLLRATRSPPVYHGRALYLTLPERLQDSVAAWWKTQCPWMTTHVVDCDDHYAILKEPVVSIIGPLINQHCCDALLK
ncbi:hypothetical protein BJX99DRAFT_255659 [Aspergillus californicus]